MRQLPLIVLLVLGLASFATAQTAAAPKPQKAKTAKTVATLAAPVNLNTATVAQLDALPGVGKSTAQRIVELSEAEAAHHRGRRQGRPWRGSEVGLIQV
jgi:DNA uptake protein ComE-like DNA-binding protein